MRTVWAMAGGMLLACGAGDSGDAGDSGGDASSGDASTGDTGMPVLCDVAEPLAPGDHEIAIDHDGQSRRYVLHVPPAHDGTIAVPLVVNMHGLLSTPESQIAWSTMNDATDARGWIGVYPAGIANSWNAGTCCGDASATGVDDVGFIHAVVDDVARHGCIDPRRIYATGMSNGGHMSFRLACDAADRFAAVAPVAGAMRVTACTPSRPIAVLAFHGVQDAIVPYADDVASIDGWVATLGCDATPAQEDFTGGNCRSWSGCDGAAALELCTLDPRGHCWPGGEPSLCFGILGEHSDAIDANTTMLDFFERHPLP